MNWWNKFETWVNSGEGIVGTFAAAGGVMLAIWKFGGNVLAFLCKGWRTLRYHWDFERNIWREFQHIEKRIDRSDEKRDRQINEIKESLEDAKDGITNGVHIRRLVMEEDQKFAWFEASENGRFEWANRFWRDCTGMSLEDIQGDGWIVGISEKERDALLRNWKVCVSKGIKFDRQATLVHRHTGTETKVRITADPGRKGKAGSGGVVLYGGHAVKL